ncbi:hypothetical protein [Streptomyces sp. NRRL WC-3549]|uniref:hypothetical protein n=1 Tax=Streptomyces sp. NRRL WC-3549 TaxID=1463925 RepID=UPI00131C828B|nr:hypothetical protein [Streptomyces sp. NRRL WC-3549]
MSPEKSVPPTPSTPLSPKERAASVFAAVVGCACVLTAAFLLLVPMPRALDDERAFREAVACAPDDGGKAGDCLWTIAARVDRTEKVQRKKSPSFWVYVTEPDGASTRTRLDGRAEDVPAAGPGKTVRVTYWRDQIRYVDLGSARRYTTADPRGDYRLYCTWGFALGLYSLVHLWLWLWATRFAHLSRRAYPWQAGVPTAGGLALAAIGAFAPWPTDSPGEALLVVGVCTPVVVLGCAVAGLIVARRQRGDDTIRLTPSAPEEERRFPGMVVGEVPYQGRGGWLVAGPGLLASTPDPTGAAFRREVPRGLRPVRVRPRYRLDPDLPDYEGKAVVLECEDDGVPVLVVTRKKTMPWVLGALETAGSGLGDAPRP